MTVDVKETDLEFAELTERSRTDMVVVHHTGSDVDASAEQIHGWHLAKGWAGIGYHYVVRRDGTVERGRPEWAIGSHAYGENGHTVGVHLSGDFTDAEPTHEQVEKTAMLLADVCTRFGIPIDRAHVVGHGELMATSCPGRRLQALLDDGTLTGKANWYANEGVPSAEPAQPVGVDGAAEGGRGQGRFNTVDAAPDWARPTVERMVAKGLLRGGGPAGLDLSLDMLRVFVVNDRAGLYGD